jgi:signal transduction histidine kinase
MNSFLHIVLNLLTTDTGGLTYQVILTFSIVGALPAALSLAYSRAPDLGWRMAAGLNLLFVFRLVLFVISGLAWQGLIQSQGILPILDRAGILLGLLIIIWLWAFPEPRRQADAATLLVGLLVVTLVTLGLVLWSNQDPSVRFNGSMPDTAAEIIALVLISFGFLALFIRRPSGWGMGISMLGIFFLGHIAHLVAPLTGSDYPAAVRLAEMIAYPLLLTLPQRVVLPVSSALDHRQTQLEGRDHNRLKGDPKAFQAMLDLLDDADPDNVCASLAAVLGQAMAADVCLLLSPLGDEKDLVVRCGFDLIREQPLAVEQLESRSFPVISAALRSGRFVHLSPSTTSPDLVNLSQALNLERSGHLLAGPIKSGDGKPLYNLILISPYSDYQWTAEDQVALASLSQRLVQFLQQKEHAGPEQELETVRQLLQTAQAEATAAQAERQKLLDEINKVRQNASQDRSQLQSLAAMVTTQEELRDVVSHLQTENEKLRQASEDAADPQEMEHLEGELHLALEELAHLRTALGKADERIVNFQAAKEQPLAQNDPMERINEIVREIRQPLVSIVGYSDFLLGESVGILGAMQRKFLERIKVSTERIERLVDELQSAGTTGAQAARLLPGAINLGQAIDAVVSESGPSLRQKNIVLRVDAPIDLPDLFVPKPVLDDILTGLLLHARDVTPEDGDILLRARLEKSEGKEDYVLVQVTDSSGGIPVEEIPALFSAHYRSNGVDNGAGPLSGVKSQVDVLGGRIWVDSDLGRGSTVSLLLPIFIVQSQESAPGDLRHE